MIRRFYVEPDMLAADSISIDGPLARRIVTVLRAKPGDQIALFGGAGDDVIVRLTSVTPRRLEGVIERREPGPRSRGPASTSISPSPGASASTGSSRKRRSSAPRR